MERLLAQATEQGLNLVGSGGLLKQRTRTVLEVRAGTEMTERFGHEHGQTRIAAKMRNDTRT
ncbi:hypothetical protein [Pseudarthrobacter sp. B4EP4b]|uniref:hypothetical protein n=1 Tax=Pseudarthrobacter sp. B4EP4b TaxID=2590664 RepID=UPI0021065470|nr:hypothetical protein [Pseudarthrobacter sp. B4EP4b]